MWGYVFQLMNTYQVQFHQLIFHPSNLIYVVDHNKWFLVNINLLAWFNYKIIIKTSMKEFKSLEMTKCNKKSLKANKTWLVELQNFPTLKLNSNLVKRRSKVLSTTSKALAETSPWTRRQDATPECWTDAFAGPSKPSATAKTHSKRRTNYSSNAKINLKMVNSDQVHIFHSNYDQTA